MTMEPLTIFGVDHETFERGPRPNDFETRSAWSKLNPFERWAILALVDGAMIRSEYAEDMVLDREAVLLSVEWSDGHKKWGMQHAVGRAELEDDRTGTPVRALMRFSAWLRENPHVGRPENDRGARVALERMQARGLAR